MTPLTKNQELWYELVGNLQMSLNTSLYFLGKHCFIWIKKISLDYIFHNMHFELNYKLRHEHMYATKVNLLMRVTK